MGENLLRRRNSLTDIESRSGQDKYVKDIDEMKNDLRREQPKPKSDKPQKKKGRSKSEVYILFVGQAGCGKSTTLNFLFGNEEISPVERETGTDKIYQFTAPLPTSEDGNEKVTLIDLPGLGDMNSIDWDGRIVKTLQNYMKGHSELKKVYPNVVVIVGRFDDNRIDGDQSSFVKMLKALNTLSYHILDNNLLVVLTHYMNGKKALREDPTPRIQMIQNLVRIHLNYEETLNVVLSENEPEDWDLKESLPGSFQLKTGSLYPDNVFDNMIIACEATNDLVGRNVLINAQKNRKSFEKKFHSGTIVIVSELEGEKMTGHLAHLYNSSVSSLIGKLQLTWNSFGNNIDALEFQELIKVLKRNNIKDEKGLPKTREEASALISQVPRHLSVFRVLESLGCHFRNYDLSKSVGSGYNIGIDNFTGNNPVIFDSSNSHFAVSLLAQRLPNTVECTVKGFDSEALVFEYLDSESCYPSERLKRMRLLPDSHEPTEVPLNFSFDLKRKDGYNLKTVEKIGEKEPSNSKKGKISKSEDYKLSTSQSNGKTLKFRKEFRIARLEINTRLLSLPISEAFTLAAKKLKPYDKRDRMVRGQWRDFFSTWGTHVLKSVFVGGACTIEINSLECQKLDKNFASLSTSCQRDILAKLATITKPTKPANVGESVKYKVKLEGGATQNEILDCWYPPDDNTLRVFQEWISDIRLNPTALENDFELLPIHLFTGEGIEYYEEAYKDLLMRAPTQESLWGKIVKFLKKFMPQKALAV